MNRFLRTAPTRRVLEALGGAILLIAVGAAIAIAATGAGPVPRRERLAVAIHRALASRAPAGITARVSFTDNLIGTSELQGSDPLLSGASGRLWLSPGGALRLELQGDNGDANLVVRGRSVWAYDPLSNTVYKATLPASRAHAHSSDRVPSVGAIQTRLARLAAHLRISGARPGDIAGRPEYTVRVAPRSSAGLLGAAELAWDAVRGVPLRFSLYARGDSSPVLSLGISHISYGRVDPSAFSISPPSGAKVVSLSGPARGSSAPAQVHVPFTLRAPASLAGLRRTAVRRLGDHGAVVLYGRPLGGVAVLETPAPPGAATKLAIAPSGDGPGLNLPTVSIGGSTAQQLQTALGTVVRFTRGGVQYTVLGLVVPRVLDAAARGL